MHNIDDLKELLEAFESATRAHENIGSQRIEDHDAIALDYKEAKEQLINALTASTQNPALAVIEYILDEDPNKTDGDSDAMDFLRYWNEGEFTILRENWNDIPNEVFIGAEVGYEVGV